jgi:hypothetical protein
MKKYLDAFVEKERAFGPGFEEYFYLHYEDDGVTFKLAEEKTGVVETELSLCGYFSIRGCGHFFRQPHPTPFYTEED